MRQRFFGTYRCSRTGQFGTMEPMSTPAEILEYWFGANPHDAAACNEAQSKLWWGKSAKTDSEIAERFGETLASACKGELDEWADDPESCAALIVVLDQFSRVIHRDTPGMFEQDDRAQALTLRMLESGAIEKLHPIQRSFVLMPLMHSESEGLQDRGVEAFATLAQAVPEDARKPFDSFHKYAIQHRDIVARFGRFPHRNENLGRESTPEELAFLEQPNSRF